MCFIVFVVLVLLRLLVVFVMMVVIIRAIRLIVLHEFAVDLAVQLTVATCLGVTAIAVAITAITAIAEMAVTITAVAAVAVTITGSVRVTTGCRDIRENQLDLLRLIYHFRYLLEGLLAERFIGLHTTDHVETNIAVLNDRVCIRHQTDRRSIDHHEVIFLTGLLKSLGQFIGVNQLTRVRRDSTGTHEVETERRVVHNDIFFLRLSDQVVGHTGAILQT